MISDLGCVTLMRTLLRLSLHVRILIIGNIKLSLRNLVNLYMTVLLDLSLIVSNLRSCGPLAYSDNERVKQLLYTLDDHIWRMRITDLEESADFATLDTKKLFSKLKFYELSRNGHPNHDTSLTSKALITSTRVDDHNANPTNTTVSSALEFVLSSLVAASDKQYESIPDDEITLLVRKFRALHKFRKERRSPRGCFECSDITHFIVDCHKRKKLDSSSNKYDYTKKNDYGKGNNKKKYRFGDKKKF
jgi:hypothetical protein